MNASDVQHILLDSQFISDISLVENQKYKNQKYDVLVSCKLIIDDELVPIKIGIPYDWELSLFDFYLDEDLSFIPHVNHDGKLCLYNLNNGVLIDQNLEGLLNTCIDKAIEVISNGKNGSNKEDFIAEFDAYFNQLSAGIVYFVVPDQKETQEIRYIDLDKEDNQKKNTKSLSYFASPSVVDFHRRKYKSAQMKGFYVYIQPKELILPPNFRCFDERSYINLLLKWVRDVQTLKRLYTSSITSLLVIFGIEQTESVVNYCAFFLTVPKFHFKNGLNLVGSQDIKPLRISRVDHSFLSRRIQSSVSCGFENKSYLIVGCGSIGGYIAAFLSKEGKLRMTLVDNDVLEEENVCRHVLGINYLYYNKAEALKKYFETSNMGISVEAIKSNLQDAIKHKKLNLKDFDYVISATGNHNVNRWLNRYIKSNELDVVALYVWNEALNIGCHVAVVNSQHSYDYDVLFARDENGELYDQSSFVMKGVNTAYSSFGCTGTYIPYGTSQSLHSSLLCLDVLKKCTEGLIDKNLLFSEKGNKCYLEREGFNTSVRYNDQTSCLSICDLKSFAKGGRNCFKI